MTPITPRPFSTWAAIACSALAGCQAAHQAAPVIIDDAARAELRHTLPIYSGIDSSPQDWSDLLAAAESADVIILGEQHDDAVGHAVQLAVVEDLLANWPDTAVSMEMLDRGKQAAVDDYLADLIDRDRFIEEVANTRWRSTARKYLAGEMDRRTFETRIMSVGWPDWDHNYQPIIEAAKSAGTSVVAANTPWLRYSRLANKDGYAGLDELTPAQSALFDAPDEVPTGKYRQRFWQIIAGRAEGEAPPESEAGGHEPDHAAQSASAHGELTDESILGMFRGQLLMDATMAASVVAALDTGATKVIHLVGQFHSDFEGGTVEQLRRRRPGIRILTVSLQNGEKTKPDEEDLGRADFIIYCSQPH